MLVSFILNVAIVVMVLFATIVQFVGWDFMKAGGALDENHWVMFKYFTTLSNVLAGICCLWMAMAEAGVLWGSAAILPDYVYLIKLAGTSAVTLTLMVTVFFLCPQSEEGPWVLFTNGNLFYHLIVPLTAILSFIFVDKNGSITLVKSLWGALPTFLYAIFYTINVFRHLKDGQVDRKYDFYNFLMGKKERAPYVIPMIIVISAVFSLLLVAGNQWIG